MPNNHPQCKLCNSNQSVDWSKPIAAIAREHEISRSSVQRHRKHDLEDVDSFFSELPNSIITSRGKSVRLEDGSWEKVSWSPGKKALLESLEYDDLEKALEDYKPLDLYTARTKIQACGDTMVILPADFQVGKHDERGGTTELIARVRKSLDLIEERVVREAPAEIVVADLGDIIENFYNTSSQRETNDVHLTEQIRIARRLILEILKRLSYYCVDITYVAVPSNHATVRVGPKSPAASPDNDFGLEISYQIEDVLKDRPGFEGVKFVRPSKWEEAVTVETRDGTVLGFVHGHQTKSHDKIGDWWKGQDHGRRSNLHKADILFVGHWHSFRVQQSGDGRWVIVAPSSDGGSSWFANLSGETSMSGILHIRVRNGGWLDPQIA